MTPRASEAPEPNVEAVGQLASLTPAADWVAVLAIAGLVILTLVWAFTGQIDTNVGGLGTTMPQTGTLQPIVADYAGGVTAVNVVPGRIVNAGEPLITLDQSPLLAQRDAAQNLLARMILDRTSRAATLAQSLQRQRNEMNGAIAALRGREAALNDAIAFQARYLADLRRLLPRGFSTKIEVEKAVTDLSNSQLNLKDTLNQIATQRISFDAAEQSAKRELDGLDEGVVRAQGSLDTLNVQLSRSNVIAAPIAGRVVQVGAARGAIVSAGQLVAMLSPGTDGLEMIAFFRVGDGKRIKPGARARIAFDSIDTAVWGTAEAKVIAVGTLPETSETIQTRIWNDYLAHQVTQAGPPLAVRLAITVGPNGQPVFTAGQPPVDITIGTTGSVLVSVERDRPISFVLPILTDLLGRP